MKDKNRWEITPKIFDYGNILSFSFETNLNGERFRCVVSDDNMQPVIIEIKDMSPREFMESVENYLGHLKKFVDNLVKEKPTRSAIGDTK